MKNSQLLTHLLYPEFVKGQSHPIVPCIVLVLLVLFPWRYLALDSIDFHIVYLVLSWLTCYTVSIKIPLHKTVFALFVILKFIFVK